MEPALRYSVKEASGRGHLGSHLRSRAGQQGEQSHWLEPSRRGAGSGTPLPLATPDKVSVRQGTYPEEPPHARTSSLAIAFGRALGRLTLADSCPSLWAPSAQPQSEGGTAPRARSEELPQAPVLDGQPCFLTDTRNSGKRVSLDSV